jgi:hypothetical protein
MVFIDPFLNETYAVWPLSARSDAVILVNPRAEVSTKLLTLIIQLILSTSKLKKNVKRK